MIYRIEHKTTYNYPSDVSVSHNLAHLAARSSTRQTCLRHELKVTGATAVKSLETDYFGNPVTLFTIQEPHRRLSVDALNVVRVHPSPPPDPAQSPPWETVRDLLRTSRDAASVDAYQFAFDSPYIHRGPELMAYAAPSFTPGRPLLAASLDLMTRIYTEFKFDAWATTIATPLTELLTLRRGVCQDFAHLQIGCLRSLGLAARYVSGYLLTSPPPGEKRLVGADASHAWLSVYCPQSGWVDLDPTNNMIPLEKHIILAWGRDYDDVSPVKGVILGGGRHSIRVGVDVAPVEGVDVQTEAASGPGA